MGPYLSLNWVLINSEVGAVVVSCVYTEESTRFQWVVSTQTLLVKPGVSQKQQQQNKQKNSCGLGTCYKGNNKNGRKSEEHRGL